MFSAEIGGLPRPNIKKERRNMAKGKAEARPTTKSESMAFIAEKTGLTRKQVAGVFEALTGIMSRDLKKFGIYTLPGLAKVKVVKKPATKARKGINPFTKEEVMFKAKPARKVVKVLALKALKDLVA
jgi:nucleoid DNA-binding protein